MVTRVAIVDDQTVFRELLAELLSVDPAYEVVGQFVPTRTDLAFSAYVQRSRPELWPAGKYPEEMAPNELFDILLEYRSLDAPTHAVTLGVSCEACHLGARQHAEGKQKKPQFFPQAPELAVLTRKDGSS
mgnify:CR=1 FL=1